MIWPFDLFKKRRMDKKTSQTIAVEKAIALKCMKESQKKNREAAEELSKLLCKALKQADGKPIND